MAFILPAHPDGTANALRQSAIEADGAAVAGDIVRAQWLD
jgi:hypothetical protein